MSLRRSIRQPLVGSIKNNIRQPGPLSYRVLFRDFSLESLKTVDTFTRASGDKWLDFDGNYRTAGINEEVYEGKRFLSPGIYSSFDLSGNLIPDLKGITTGPAVTNKCQTFGFVPDDEIQPSTITGNDSDMSGPNSWSDAGSGATVDTTTVPGKLYLKGNGGNDWAAISGKTEKGKLYTVSLKARLKSGASTLIKLGRIQTDPENYFELTPTGIEQTFTGTFLSIGTGTILLGLGDGVGFNGVEFEFDDVVVQEVKYAVGTKSFHDGSVFIQNIDGMTLSGDVAGVLSIIDDTAQLDTDGYGGVERNGKCYNLTSVSASLFCAIAGDTGNTNVHDLGGIVKHISGSTKMELSGSGGVINIAFTNIDFQNINLVHTPTVTNGQLILNSSGAGSSCNFLLTGLYEQSYAPRQPVPSSSLIASTTRSASLATLPVQMPQGFEITIEVTPDVIPAELDAGVFRLLGTNDSRGDNNTVGAAAFSTYSLVMRAEGGCVFTIDSLDIVKDAPVVFKMSAKQNGPNVDVIILKDGVEKLNSSVAGVLDHSNLGEITAGSHIGFNLPAQVKQIEVKAI